MKMLICDDDQMSLRALEFQFKREGYEIIKAVDGRVASKILSENEDIDVMITDVFMPHVSGLELITYARRTLQRLFPIIVVSRANIDDNINFALDLGADAYMIKPFNLEELSRIVNNLLNE